MEGNSSTDSPATLSFQLPSLPYLRELLLTYKMLSPFYPVIIVFGLLSNTLNIVIFLKAGAKDNVTILLLSLSISDLVFLVLVSPYTCAIFIFGMDSNYAWPFDWRFVGTLFYWPAYTAFDLSSSISVSLAVMRCACVAMPLKFKLVFTRTRTLAWVMFLVVFSVCLRIPVLTIERVGWHTDPSTNISSLVVKSFNNDVMTRINDVLNRGFMIYFTYATMVTSVSVLTFKLAQSARIRRGMSGPSESSGEPVTNLLSNKDVQVIKSVVLVCAIFILFQLPFLLTSTIRLIIPQFDPVKGLGYLFGIFGQIYATCSFLNASVNIFVYYNYNSKYRQVFLSLLPCGCDKSSVEQKATS